MIEYKTQKNYSVRLYDKDGDVQYMNQFHFRGFRVKYYGATKHKSSRVRLYDTRHKDKVWLSYSYKYGDIRSQAIAYLRDIGILSDGFTYDELTGVYTILTTDFKTKINELLSI